MLVIEIVDRAVGIALAFRRQESRSGIDAGIGENDVDASMLAGDLVEGLGHRRSIGNIYPLAPCIAARLPDRRHGLVQSGLIDIENTDASAVFGHDLGIGAADAAGTAGDDHRLAADVEHFLQRRHPYSSLADRPVDGAVFTISRYRRKVRPLAALQLTAAVLLLGPIVTAAPGIVVASPDISRVIFGHFPRRCAHAKPDDALPPPRRPKCSSRRQPYAAFRSRNYSDRLRETGQNLRFPPAPHGDRAG